MPLIYLVGGPYHHDMREVDELQESFLFRVRDEKYKPIDIGGGATVMQEQEKIVRYVYYGRNQFNFITYVYEEELVCTPVVVVGEGTQYLTELLDALENIFMHDIKNYIKEVDENQEEK